MTLEMTVFFGHQIGQCVHTLYKVREDKVKKHEATKEAGTEAKPAKTQTIMNVLVIQSLKECIGTNAAMESSQFR